MNQHPIIVPDSFLLEIMIFHPVLRYGKCRMFTPFAQAHTIKPGGFGYEPGYVTYGKRSRTPEIG